jgi:hypothetical protein
MALDKRSPLSARAMDCYKIVSERVVLMNGPKFSNDFGKGIHNHIHDNPGNASDNTDLKAVIAKDALLLQDRSTTRAHFQGRFRKTVYGDFKNRPGRADEQSEALQHDYVFEQAKEEAAWAAQAIVDAAAADGVIVEDTTPPNDIAAYEGDPLA